MEHKQHHGNGGFLLGILIGVAITLLFTTKRGRRVLKTLTDEGMDKIGSLEELFEKKMREEEIDDMGLSDYDAKPTVTTHPAPTHTHYESAHTHPAHHEPVQHVHTEPLHSHTEPLQHVHDEPFMHVEPEVPSYERVATTGRRFFRGVPKRPSN